MSLNTIYAGTFMALVVNCWFGMEKYKPSKFVVGFYLITFVLHVLLSYLTARFNVRTMDEGPIVLLLANMIVTLATAIVSATIVARMKSKIKLKDAYITLIKSIFK